MQELTKVPGIGQSTAARIISYRRENGDFSSLEELKEMGGIRETHYQQMLPYLTIE